MFLAPRLVPRPPRPLATAVGIPLSVVAYAALLVWAKGEGASRGALAGESAAHKSGAQFEHDVVVLGAEAAAWRAEEGGRAWIATREQAIDHGWYGEVDPEVLPRIGDVIVAARKRIAYYDSRPADQSARGMIGQHGSLTDDERRIPLLGLGRYEP